MAREVAGRRRVYSETPAKQTIRSHTLVSTVFVLSHVASTIFATHHATLRVLLFYHVFLGNAIVTFVHDLRDLPVSLTSRTLQGQGGLERSLPRSGDLVQV